MTAIVQKEHPVLRELTQAVPVSDITAPKIRNLLADMREALAGEEDGVGLAAPQIGVPMRVFIVGGTVKENDKDIDLPELVCINPEIVKASKDREELDEGCLSVRWLYGKVPRATKVRIRYYNEHAELCERGGSGLLAQIFQHEIDHLDGILFIDKATDVHEILPENSHE